MVRRGAVVTGGDEGGGGDERGAVVTEGDDGCGRIWRLVTKLVNEGNHLEAVEELEAGCSFVKTSVDEDCLLHCQAIGWLQQKSCSTLPSKASETSIIYIVTLGVGFGSCATDFFSAILLRFLFVQVLWLSLMIGYTHWVKSQIWKIPKNDRFWGGWFSVVIFQLSPFLNS